MSLHKPFLDAKNTPGFGQCVGCKALLHKFFDEKCEKLLVLCTQPVIINTLSESQCNAELLCTASTCHPSIPNSCIRCVTDCNQQPTEGRVRPSRRTMASEVKRSPVQEGRADCKSRDFVAPTKRFDRSAWSGQDETAALLPARRLRQFADLFSLPQLLSIAGANIRFVRASSSKRKAACQGGDPGQASRQTPTAGCKKSLKEKLE